MSIHQVDDEGNIWFISSKESNKNFEVTSDKRVQLFFTSMSDSHYLSVFGDVTIYKDKEEIDTIWNSIANAWFEESINDATVIIIKVTPTNVYHWDSNENKVVLNLKPNVPKSIKKEYAS